MPAGPEPMTATFLPVLRDGGSGTAQPSAMARSAIAHSMVLMATGLSSMLSVQDASHGAGQTRPVTSGKLLVECRLRAASRQSPRKTRSFQSGIWLFTGQPVGAPVVVTVPWQNGMPQSMQRAAVFVRHHLAEHGRVPVPVGEDLLGARRSGVVRMPADQEVQPLGVVAGKVGKDINPAVRVQVRKIFPLRHVLLPRNPLERPP